MFPIIILTLPFVLLGFRYLAQWLTHGTSERVYMSAAKDCTILLLCGTTLLTCLFSRLVSTTPFYDLENETIMTYVIIEIMATILEFRKVLYDATVPLLFQSLILYQLYYQREFYQDILYWVTVFSCVRGFETIASSLTLDGGSLPLDVLRICYRHLSRLEFAVIYLKCIHRTLTVEELEIDVLIVCACASVIYFGRFADTHVFHGMDRASKTTRGDRLYLVHPEQRMFEDAVRLEERHRYLLENNYPIAAEDQVVTTVQQQLLPDVVVEEEEQPEHPMITLLIPQNHPSRAKRTRRHALLRNAAATPTTG
jgi:hypothetical protein